MNKKQKGLAPIIIILIIVVLLAGGILACPPKFLKEKFERVKQYFGAPKEEIKILEEVRKDETADWKTYRNEEYGYEIKYPQDWEVDETIKDTVGLFKSGQPPVHIRIYPNPQRIPIGQWIEKKENIDHWHVKNKEPIFVEGIEGIKLIHENGVSFVESFVSKEELIYEISISSETPNISVFDQMLSTFRFLE